MHDIIVFVHSRPHLQRPIRKWARPIHRMTWFQYLITEIMSTKVSFILISVFLKGFIAIWGTL